MTKETRLGLVLGINLAMIAGLVVVGLLSHSLGVLSSASDYVGDAAGVGLSLVALRMSRDAHGHPRATSFAALANASFLLLITLAVATEAVNRLVNGSPEIHGLPVLVISVIAAGAMLLCAHILGSIEAEDFNMRSVMLDTVADVAAAIGVAISGAVILAADGLYWLDAAVALVIAIVVGYHALRLIREVIGDLRRKSGQRSG
ncbi:MAG TPA: cation diffusion facilitator family transporter [Solirubrobacterales bacterium]|nr:cation diffusion facilitator family transporter [Solirubrobacterales bacterium]